MFNVYLLETKRIPSILYKKTYVTIKLLMPMKTPLYSSVISSAKVKCVRGGGGGGGGMTPFKIL